MKTLALCAFALLAAAGVRGAQFEGRIILQRGEPPARPHDVIYAVKGDKVRVEVIRDQVTSFMTDTTKKETITILTDDMAYVVMHSLEPLTDDIKLEKTDEKSTVLGIPVQKYTVTSEEGFTELWLAEGFGKYTGFGDGFEMPPPNIPNVDLPQPPAPWHWEYALAGKPLFPLRVTTVDDTGKVTFRLEAKAITPQPLADSLFVPSVNYKKLETWPENRG